MISHQYFLEIGQVADLASLEARLTSFAHELDFGLFGAIAITPDRDGKSVFTMLNNAPSGFEEATRNVPDSMRDPVLQRLKSDNLPFAYDQATYVDSGAADLWEEQAPFGYRTGIAVALPLPDGKRFMLGFDRPDPLPSDDRSLTWLLAALQLLAVHAQDATVRLLTARRAPGDFPLLTPRELEILQWTHVGKTAWEISRILAISQWTVNFHVRNILAKCQVRSKREVVAWALECGKLE